MNKFNIGETVRIKGYDWWRKVTNDQMYKIFMVQSFNNSVVLFEEKMLEFLNKEATIVKIGDLGYKLNISGYGEVDYIWPEDSLIKSEDSSNSSNSSTQNEVVNYDIYRTKVASDILIELISKSNCENILDINGDLYVGVAIDLTDKLINALKNNQKNR